jgi:hypothetical protein
MEKIKYCNHWNAVFQDISIIQITKCLEILEFYNRKERNNGDFVNTFQLIFQTLFHRRPELWEQSLEIYVCLNVFFGL